MTATRRFRPIVRIDDRQQMHLGQLASLRRPAPGRGGDRHRVDRSRSRTEVNVAHMHSLWAVCRQLEVFLPTPDRISHQTGPSFLKYKGMEVMVRYNKLIDGDFYLPLSHEFIADVAVLCYPAAAPQWPERWPERWPGIQIAGFLRRDDWYKLRERVDYGFGPVFAVGQSMLRNFQDLLDYESKDGWAVQKALL